MAADALGADVIQKDLVAAFDVSTMKSVREVGSVAFEFSSGGGFGKVEMQTEGRESNWARSLVRSWSLSFEAS